MRMYFTDDEEEDFTTSLWSHPTVGMKMTATPGLGDMIGATSARVAQRESAVDNVDAPVYSLRRMVPPGR